MFNDLLNILNGNMLDIMIHLLGIVKQDRSAIDVINDILGENDSLSKNVENISQEFKQFHQKGFE